MLWGFTSIFTTKKTPEFSSDHELGFFDAIHKLADSNDRFVARQLVLMAKKNFDTENRLNYPSAEAFIKNSLMEKPRSTLNSLASKNKIKFHDIYDVSGALSWEFAIMQLATKIY